MRWDSRVSVEAAKLPPTPSMWLAVRRGLLNRCPCCGAGRVFDGYLALVPECEVCGAQLGMLRADDAPPYFTILLTGHLLVPGVLWVERHYMPPMWLHMTIWLPLFTIVCVLLLRPVKGAVVGWMSRLGFLVSAAALPARGRDA